MSFKLKADAYLLLPKLSGGLRLRLTHPTHSSNRLMAGLSLVRLLPERAVERRVIVGYVSTIWGLAGSIPAPAVFTSLELMPEAFPW